MNWNIELSPDSVKFINLNHLTHNVVTDKIKLALKKFRGEEVNIDIRKLSGEWEGFYRIRSGKLRIIAEFQFEYYRVYIDKVDWRGNIYK
ncbi:MAG: hypothetical protein AAB861_02585 [Patescibacteria group bacterium]